MHLDDATVKSLRSFLLQTLATISSDLPDPEPLADYVIAMLKEDKTDEELRHTVRTHCYEFLRDKTLGFVTDLFAFLSKVYRPTSIRDSGAIPVYGSPRASRESDHEDVPARRRRSASPPKRRYDDSRHDRADRSERAGGRSALPIPTVDFYDRRRRWDDGGHRGRGDMDDSQFFPRQRERDRAPEDVIALASAGPPIPTGPPPMMLPPGVVMPVPVLDAGFVSGMDRYGNMAIGVVQPLPQRFHGDDDQRGPKREKRWRRDDEGGSGGRPHGGGGAAVEAGYEGAGGERWQRRPKGEKQFRNPESSTIKVMPVPPELNTAEKLIGHFKQFGSIINIQISVRDNRATVQFARHEEALAALRSPEAVLNNRFIKIFWSNEDDGAAGKEAAAAAAAAATAARIAESAPPAASPSLRTSGPRPSFDGERAPPPPPPAPVPDKAAIARRQQREEIRKQIAGAIALADKVKDPIKKAEVVKMIDRLVASLETSVKKEKDAEAAAARAAPPVAPPAEFSPRGRGRGSSMMARGGRGGVAPRGGRGRGRGAPAAQTGGRTLVLDNRPTTLVIANPPAELSGDKLLAHFKPFGEVTSFSVANTHATVQFATRRSAEVALNNGKSMNGSELAMSWLMPAASEAAEAAALAEAVPQTEVVPLAAHDVVYNDSERQGEAEAEEGDGERNWKR